MKPGRSRFNVLRPSIPQPTHVCIARWEDDGGQPALATRSDWLPRAGNAPNDISRIEQERA